MIIKAPIRQPEIAGANKIKRDPATNLPLDDEGRYAQQISVDGKMHAPKYFPGPTASAGCGGQNLDMSDPGTVAYVKALDQKILSDIGNGATMVVIVNPVGAAGAVAGLIGQASSLTSGLLDGQLKKAGSKEILTFVVQRYLQRVCGIGSATAVRIVSLIELSGGWQAFVDRGQQEVKNMQGDKK